MAFAGTEVFWIVCLCTSRDHEQFKFCFWETFGSSGSTDENELKQMMRNRLETPPNPNTKVAETVFKGPLQGTPCMKWHLLGKGIVFIIMAYRSSSLHRRRCVVFSSDVASVVVLKRCPSCELFLNFQREKMLPHNLVHKYLIGYILLVLKGYFFAVKDILFSPLNEVELCGILW